MLFHLLGAGQPVANFTSTSQTIAESSGTWAGWASSLSSWTRRRQILVDGVTGALTDFPVMIKLDSTRIDYAQVQSAGQDLRFTNDAGTVLPYEIEKWDAAGTSIVWVKVPTLSAYPTKSSIWMYYGNASASAGQSSAAWDASFAKVMHLNGTTGAIANGATISSSIGVAATASNAGSGMSYAAGQVANGIVLDGTDDWIDLGSDASLNFGANSPFTVSIFFKTTDSTGPIVNFREVITGYPIIGLYIGNNGASAQYGKVNVLLRDDSGLVYAQLVGPTIDDGVWHHIVLSRNAGASVSLYVDGVSYGTASGAGTGGAITTTKKAIGSDRMWALGGYSVNDMHFAGTVDELQVSTAQRSADWIQASYLSARDELAAFRSEETPTSGAAIITVSLNTPAQSTITIPYTVSGTATAGTDHSRVSGNLTINGGSSSGSLNTYVLRDNLVEGSETAILTLGAPTGASLGTDTVHTVTITDEVLSPPDAVDDSLNITNFNSVIIPVLANDTDPNGDTLMITSFTAPSAGTAVRVGQTIRYTPTQNFPATDSFTYTISDGRGGTDTATVTLSYQIPFTWIGSGADANWTTTANWLGGVVPGASDTAYFNNQCTTYCNPSINGNVSVAGLRMNSSFSGTITQTGANTVTVGAAGWNQKAGVFAGGTSAITINSGAFILTGGTFTSTSATMLFTTAAISSDFTPFSVGAAATFAHNSGTLQFNGNSAWGTNPIFTIDAPNGFNVNNLILHQNQARNNNTVNYTPTSGRVINVLGDLTHGMSQYAAGSGASTIGGTWQVQGQFNVGSDAIGGAGNISLTGTGAQAITSDSNGYTADLTINKTSGIATASSSTLRVRRLLLDQGTFVAPSSQLELYRYISSGTSTVMRIASGTTYTSGASSLKISADSVWGVNSIYEIDVPDLFQFNAVTLAQATAANADTVTYRPVGARMIVATGNLAFGNSAFAATAGKLYVNGAWEARANYSVGTEVKGGTAAVTLTGTAAQSVTIASTAVAPSGTFTVNKSSGTASLTASASFNVATQDVTIASGILNLAGFNLTVNDVLTISSGAKLLCNGGSVTAGSTSISGELSCGTSLGITWIGTTGDGLWSTAGNWTNGTIPGASDIAYFNSQCTSCNATANSAVSVKGIVMASSYTGTIAQSAGNALTIGTSGWSQAAGTFTGANAAIAMNGAFALSGGTFTSTSGTMTTQANFVLSGSPTFNHNSGTVVLSGPGGGTNSFTPGAAPFWNVTFSGFGVHFNIAGTLSVNGLLTLADTYGASANLNGGTIVATGNVTFTNNGKMGTVLLRVAGSSNQTITGSAAAWIPQFEIASTGGTVSFIGTLQMYKAYTYTSGVVDAGTSTLVLSGAGGASNAVIPGTVQYNNVTFTGFGITSTITGTMTVNGTLTLDDTYSASGSINTGTIEAKGNIVFSNYGKIGTGLLRVAGAGNQTITGAASASILNFEIASTGGVVTFVGTLMARRNYTYTSGTVDAGTSTLYLTAPDGGSATIVPGAPTYNNVTFGGASTTFALTGTLTVAGTLLLNDGSSGVGSINGGTILASGNVTVSNYGKIGTVLIRIVGSASQTLSGVAGGYWPETEIASTGGTVSLSGTLYMRKNLTYTSGTFSSGTSTVLFAAADGTSTTFTPGAVTYNNVSFNGAGTTTVISGTVTANGIVTFSDGSSGTGSVNSGSIIANGNIVYLVYGKLGSAVLTASGATAATVSMATTALRMPTLMTVNKSGGNILSLLTNVNYTGAGQDVTVSAGTFDLSGYDLAVADVLTIGAGGTLRCNGGAFTSASLVNSGTINCPGYSGYEFNWTGAGGNSDFSTAGNWTGGVSPSATSVVVFNDTYCGANCSSTMSGVTSVKGIQLQSPYTGTITQNGGASLTVGSRGLTLAAGTFTQGAAIDLVGPIGLVQSGGVFNAANFATHFARYNQSGGTFNASNGTLQIGHNFTYSNTDGFVVSGGTFNHGSGTVEFMNSYSSSGNDRYMVIDVPAGGFTFYNLVVNYQDTFSVYSNGYGEIASGDIITVANNLTLKNGRLMQGTVLVNGNLDVQCSGGNWSTSDVCADGGSTTVRFIGATAHTYAFQSGALGPYLEIPTGETVTPAGGTTLAHFGKLKVSGGAFTAPTGVMQIGNDYYYSYTDGFVVSSGTFTHNNGTVEFMGSFSSSNNDRYTMIDAPVGGLQLYNVIMNVRDTSTLYNHGYVEITAGDTVVVNHNLTLKNGRFDGGTIDLYGSLDVQCAGGNATTSDVCADGGTVQVRFLGAGSQTVTQASGGLPPQGAWTVNKTGGSVLLGSALNLSGTNQDLTITAGTFDMAGYNLTVARNIANSGTLKRGNSPTCGTVSQGGTFTGNAAICP